MKKTMSLLLITVLLSNCASHPYYDRYGYCHQPVYRGNNTGYPTQTTYVDRDSRSSEGSGGSDAGWWLLGGLAAAAILFSDFDSSTTDSSSSWSDGQEAAWRREQNRSYHDRDPSAPLPFPGEGF